MTIVDTIRARAALPLAEARALPGECYTSAEQYDLEVERIFRREWMCVARVEQIANPGDWIALDLVGEPIVLTRDDEGALHALSRVCAHRAQDVLNDTDERTGNAARFTCPYHQWSYRLDGSCIGAPDMQGSAFDAATCPLGTFPLEVWQGFVFVNLDRYAPPLAEHMAGLDALLGDVDMSDWTLARTIPWGEQPANWKIVIENGCECYHHMGPHRESLEPVFPHASIPVDVSQDDHWIAGHMVISEQFAIGERDGHRLHPLFFNEPAPGTSPLQQSETMIAGVFPMFFVSISPDFAAWFAWYPTGPESHHLDLQLILPPKAYAQPDRETILDQITEVLNAIQTEDAHNNAGLQKMLQSRHAVGGPLSKLEYPIWRFQRYLASRLT